MQPHLSLSLESVEAFWMINALTFQAIKGCFPDTFRCCFFIPPVKNGFPGQTWASRTKQIIYLGYVTWHQPPYFPSSELWIQSWNTICLRKEPRNSLCTFFLHLDRSALLSLGKLLAQTSIFASKLHLEVGQQPSTNSSSSHLRKSSSMLVHFFSIAGFFTDGIFSLFLIRNFPCFMLFSKVSLGLKN